MAFANADGINGGKLYDQFWAVETGFSLANSSLKNQSELDAITKKADFFRCKQCHSWDRLGRDGGYGNRAPSTSRPNVANINLATISASATAQALFDAIKNGPSRRDVGTDLSTYNPAGDTTVGDKMPNYSQILTDKQIWDIVKFLKEEAVDTSALYTITFDAGTYPNKKPTFSDLGSNGSPSNGDTIFAAKCAGCHGADGTLIQVDTNYTVGRHVRAKPYEDQHKVKFGHLGSDMTAAAVLSTAPTSDIKDLFAALSNKTKYPDAAPVVIDGAALYQQKCSTCHGNAKRTRTAAQIRAAIQNPNTGMGILSGLTDAELNAIDNAF